MLDGDADSFVLDEDEGIELELNRNVRFFFTPEQHRKENAINGFQFRAGHLAWSFASMHCLHLWLHYATSFVNTHHFTVILEVTAPLEWFSAYCVKRQTVL